LHAHRLVSAAGRIAYQASDPASFNPNRSLSFLFLALLITLGLCGWGCGGGIGSAAKSVLSPNAASSTDAGSSSANSAAPAANTPPNSVSLLHFGSAGFGGDDTNVLQTALNYTAANGQTLEIPAGSYNINPLSFPNNANVFVDAGVTMTANPGYGANTTMLNISSSNVKITGAGAAVSVFHMRKSEYTSGEQRHCMYIVNASNVTVSGISCNDSGGDGLYLAGSTNVTVEDCIFNNNRRQGSSITGGVNHVFYRARCPGRLSARRQH
jgi:parallel beta-helix repeat protein